MKGHDPTFHRKYRKGERPLHWVICECEWQSPVSWYAHTVRIHHRNHATDARAGVTT
jgi:hypothetical protein